MNDLSLIFFWFGVPLICVITMAFATSLGYNVRYAAAAFPAYIIILALGIASVRSVWPRYALVAAILLVNGRSLLNFYFSSDYAREDARAAVNYMESLGKSSDVVAVAGNWVAVRYYTDPAVPLHILVGPHVTSVPQARVQEIAKDHDRLWVIGIRFWADDLLSQLEAALDGSHTLRAQRLFRGTDVYLFERVSQS